MFCPVCVWVCVCMCHVHVYVYVCVCVEKYTRVFLCKVYVYVCVYIDINLHTWQLSTGTLNLTRTQQGVVVEVGACHPTGSDEEAVVS